jgi:hypothetical protein
MEPEIVGWLADRDEAIRASGPYCNKSTTSAKIFAAKLYVAFAALFEKKIFENEPPLLCH